MSDQPEIRIYRDPLRPGEYQGHEAVPGVRLIDWLCTEYPAGFGRPIVLHVNGRRLSIERADYVLQPGDLVHVLVQPGVAVPIGTLIAYAVVSAVISAVATIAFNLIFKPKNPSAQNTPQPDSIYSISGAQVAARLGEPVPVIYGQVATVPDYASQPYVFFQNNDQYLDQLLAIGQGEHDLLDLVFGETPVSAMETGAVQYWLFNPADHGQAMGTIEAATGVMENVVTSAEVGDQELSGKATGDVVEVTEHVWFEAPNQITFVNTGPPAGYTLLQVSGSERNNGNYHITGWNDATDILTVTRDSGGNVVQEEPSGGVMATLRYYKSADQLGAGPFVTSRPGAAGNRIMADFVFPQGLYEAGSDGSLLRTTIQAELQYQPIADDGTALGGWTAWPFTVTRNTNTPVRITATVDVPPGRYRVRVQRITEAPIVSTIISSMTWTGLKFRLVPTVGPIYGPVTLLATRLKATNGIANQAQNRIRAIVQRKLPPMGSGAAVPSASPADAFCDVLTNQVYGAGRPLSEVDLVELARIAASWAGQAKFNGAFSQRSTIWEALNIVLQTANAAPLPTGQLMSLAQEGVKATRRQLFTDANMTRGSLAVGYSFDKPGDYDGVRVEYRDPATWNPLYVTISASAETPDQVQLFGCSDATQAAQFAQLLWQKRRTLRKTANFETELEGLLARMGDRIGVAADLPRWGMSGVVVGVSGLALWLDKRPDWTGSGHLIVLRDEHGMPSEPISVAPGTEPNQVQLAAAPPFALFPTGMQEPTHYVFGDSVQLVRDFTVQTMEPRGGTLVGIEALAYDPATFDGTLPWLENAT